VTDRLGGAAEQWRRIDSDSLVAHLRSRRWFGDKGRAVTSARIADVVPIAWQESTGQFAVARAEVVTDAGTSTYQLFLAKPGELADAVADEHFRRGLVDAFARPDAVIFAAGSLRWIVEAESQRLVVPDDARVALSTAEQSNTSIVIGEAAILKLYRKLEYGIQPDVEVARFLTRDRAFPHVPALLGSIRFEDPRGVSVAGMLQELVPGAVDGWRYALEASRRFFETDETRHPFSDDAHTLGEMTRALHEALASGDQGSEFDTRAATRADVAAWTRAAIRMIDGAGVADRQRHAQRVERIAGQISDDAGAMARTHGDYHLGQVLRSKSNQFLAIDFEGEPARPLSERRQRQSPLRDVAGMLRSFAYAAAVGAGSGKDSRALARADAWERGAREAFLRGYFKAQKGASLLPRSTENTRRLIALFETEKVFYELRYELDHRPDWVWIPQRGIAKLET
jgi:maltose alpha-D-glucosyltransferase/alpha-amylase